MTSEHIEIGDISPVIRYVGDGFQTEFTYPFPIFDASDLKVYFDDNVSPETSGFTVNGVGFDGGGSVMFAAAPSLNRKVTLARELPVARTSDFQEGEFRAKVLNDEFDKIVAMMQELEALLSSSLQLAKTDATDRTGGFLVPDKDDRATRYLAFDADGRPIAAAGQVSGSPVPVSTFMETVLDDADAATALATLGGVSVTGSGAGLSGVLKTGGHALNLPASVWRAQATNGCGPLSTEETASNNVITEFRSFDSATEEYAQVWFRSPKSSDEAASLSGAITWKEASSATAHVCRWEISAQALGDGDTIDAAWGTAVAVDDTGTAGTLREIAFSGLTPAGSWAEGDWIGLRISRAAGHANDTLDVDAHFIGLQLLLTLNAANDA